MSAVVQDATFVGEGRAVAGKSLMSVRLSLPDIKSNIGVGWDSSVVP